MRIIDSAVEPVLRLPRVLKRTVALCLDFGLCIFSTWIALYLRLGEFVPLSGPPWPAAVISPLIAMPIFIRFGLYRAVFRYVGAESLLAIANAVMIYGVVYFSIFTAFGIDGVPRTLGIIQPILLLIGIAVSRIFGRYVLGRRYRELWRRTHVKSVLIYGAGSAGRQLAAAIGDSRDMNVVGFLDDDKGLQRSVIGGKTIFAPADLNQVVADFDVGEILLAIPSATRRRRHEILNRIRGLGVGIRTLPSLMEVARGSVTVTDLRPLEVDDLLGRDPVPHDASLLDRKVRNNIVLVTGAGGSIGSELCRQLLEANPATLILVENSEYALYQIHQELERRRDSAFNCETIIFPILASVTDQARMRRIFATWRPNTVYHAAAFKHVPLVEHNIVEGVRNNVVGTWICAQLAHQYLAKNFVLISTDKAVRPTNVMGASKRLAELGLQALASVPTPTRFCMVRFGNVLGSSGSVVPLFREQIRSGGPVTVTHPEITRYFMTIPEAAQLVLHSSGMAEGGEVFVLDMGQPVKVLDLAKRMIALSGQRLRTEAEPDGDIEIVFTGLRPGEKLYEELLIGNNPVETSHPRVMMANEQFLPPEEYEAGLAKIQDAIDRQDAVETRCLLAKLVGEYVPAEHMVDYLPCAEHPPQLKMVKPIRNP